MNQTPDLAIERLMSADVGPMRELLAVFADAFDEHETYLGAVPESAYLGRLLAKPHFIALVARRGGAVIGGAVAYELEKFEQQRSEVYIYDLAVALPHRRQGVATALIEAVRRIAKEQGAYVVIIQADSGDTPAVTLYGKLGVREDVHHFDIPV
ncbi:MAG: AAC(3)-I family aminoglycoside N-acetyltransferase [Magnetovibrio sp.]|nr:AAC(3)-I family aminoglycoside N-acetyltransferase [Magnetovibrio sp.]